MQQFVILAGLIALSSAQGFHPGYLDIPGVAPPPWQGPLADHINGIPPMDTPEVAAAKAALNQAYSQVLAVLPELPPQERYRSNALVPVVQHVPVTNHIPFPQQPFGVQPVAIVPTVRSFAEDVPRSAIGEVPEVHAARVAHLKAFQEAAALLPRLADTYVQPAVHQYQNIQPTIPQHPGLAFQNYLYSQQPAAHHVVQDTPEVAKAKADHAAAVAAALG